MMLRQFRGIVLSIGVIGVATLLAGCGGGSAPQPSPTTSGLQGSDGGGSELDHGWVVTATTQYLTASNRICSWQSVLPTTPHDFEVGWNGTQVFSLYSDGGYPDSWDPSAPPTPTTAGVIGLDFTDGTWEGRIEIGTAGTVGYTYWQTFGDFTTELDSDGRLIGGTGTGETFHTVTPDVSEYLDEVLTITVEPAPDAPWCDEAEAAWGG